MNAPATAQSVRGPGYPEPGKSSPPELARYLQQLLAFTQRDATARYKIGARNLLWADGEQWIDFNARTKNWEREPNPQGRIRATLNYLRPILRSRLQRLTSAEVSYVCTPQSMAAEERDRATVGQNFLQARYAGADMDGHTRLALWLAFSCGIAAAKQFWDETLGRMTMATKKLPLPDGSGYGLYYCAPNGEPIRDERGMPLNDPSLAWHYREGDVNTAIRSVFNLRINPDAHGMRQTEGCRWIIDSEILPISVIKERWKERAQKVQAQRNAAAENGEQRNYERILKAVSLNVGQDFGYTPAADGSSEQVPDSETQQYTEYWEYAAGGQPGRFIAMAGDEVLYPLDGDEDGLPDGIVPYEPFYDEIRMFDWGGRGCVNDMLPPQQVINRNWSWILEEQRAAGTAQWIGYNIPGLFDQITNGFAAHIKVPMSSAAGMQVGLDGLIKRVDPANAAPDRWRLIEKAEEALYSIGAFHEVTRGQVPPGVDSGVAVQALQEAENGQLHDAVRNLKRSLIGVGRQWLTIARKRYGPGEERWIPVDRPDMKYLVESVSGEDLPDPDLIKIDLDGFRPHSPAAMRAELLDLAEKFPDQFPVDRLMKLLDLGRGTEALFESHGRQYSKARTENLAIEKAEVQVVTGMDGMPHLAGADGMLLLLPEDDDPAVHLEVLQELLLDTTKPPEVRKLALLHADEHRAAVVAVQAKAAATAAALSAPPPGAPTAASSAAA